MTDWIKHDGGPQPVDDAVWVGVIVAGPDGLDSHQVRESEYVSWAQVNLRRTLNQHLIDAALKLGIELGLEAANKAVEALYADDVTDRQMALKDASMAVCALNHDTIANEARSELVSTLGGESPIPKGHPKETIRVPL